MAEDPITIIAVVLDPHFGAALAQVAARAHVWITPSAANTAAVQGYWQAQREAQAASSVTAWRTPRSGATRAEWLGMLDDLDLHHGLTGPDSIITGVRIYGAASTPHAHSAFTAFGFVAFETCADGFLATRTGRSADSPITR